MYKKLIFLISLAVLFSTASASADLVAHWRLDDGSGTVARDSSGNGYDGTVGGTVNWVAGKNGGALDFDGSSTYIDMDYEVARGTWSLAMWLKPRDIPYAAADQDYYAVLHNDAWNAGSLHAHLRQNTSLWNPEINGGPNISSTTVLQEDQWYHCVFTITDSAAQIYINGVLESESTTGNAGAYLGPLNFGSWNNAGRNYHGLMDDIRVYDHILSEAEIAGAMEGKPWPYAFGPEPEEGAVLEATWANLKWQPGQLAVSHNVYISDNLADVEAGAESAFVGSQAEANLIVGFPGFPLAEGLVLGTTYYWRVDEVNDADPNSPWKGDVWSFWVPSKKAYGAAPTDGVNFVKPDATVSWVTGFDGKLAQMYFGTDAAEVDAGTGDAAKGPVVGTTYDPGPLEKGTTYYWRVDQFDGIENHKGDVWSFTTVPVIAVSDPSLLGWWKLDEGEGTTAVDWSGHDGHGSFVGEPQWVDGYQGSALEFDGGEFVNCGDNAATGVTVDFTLAAWVKMNPGNAGQYLGIAGKLDNVGGYHGFGLVRHNTTNLFRLWVSDGDTGGINGMASSDVTYTDTDWHHVTGVREGQINMLYVDGVRQAAGNATDFVPSPDFFHIGRQYSHLDDRYFDGKIDDVRVYNKALTDAEIADVMLGDTKMAGNPVPGRDALLDIRDISSLSWSRGSTAASHDVYFGTDRDAVAGADNTAPEFQGNQAGTSLSLASLVEFGGGDYYWRIDEVEAGGAVNTGTIWKFTVPDYLIVDNFESYNDIDPPDPASNTIYGSWADGYGIPTNGALTANELPPYAEQTTVLNGFQSMKYLYDTNLMICESTLTLDKGDWTVEGVTKLMLWFKGASANAAEKMFVALNGNAVVYHDDPAASQITGWNEWVIDLQEYANQGVDLTNVTSITIGFGTKSSPAAGGAGTVYFDDILLIR